MGTAILSIGYWFVGLEVLSLALLALACAGWLLLAGVFVLQFARHHARWRTGAGLPSSLTAVAATTVLGARFALVPAATPGWVLLALAVLAWAVLLPIVGRRWRTPTTGGSFLVCVATEGLAVLGATLAWTTDNRWIGLLAGVAFVLGLVMYVPVLANFDRRQIVAGAGDHWVAGGALAIAALAGAKLLLARNTIDLPDPAFGLLRGLTVLVLVLALVWYLALAVAEVRWPRLSYDLRRWSTVFPLGMTATATMAAGQAEHLRWLWVLGHVLIWPALVVWALTAAGTVRQVARWQGWAGRPG